METKLIEIQPSNSIPSNQKAIELRPADITFFIILNLALMTAIAIPIYAFITNRTYAF